MADFEVSKDQRQIWTAWLPSSERGTIPSSPLLLEEPEEPGEVKLSAWETPAIVLSNEQAISVLVAALGRTTWGPGVVVGKTLSYWASVLSLAAALVARQQYLPGLDVQGDGAEFFARWEPVLIGEDRLAAERLARSMPHACRCFAARFAAPAMVRSKRRDRQYFPRYFIRLSTTWFERPQRRRLITWVASSVSTISGFMRCGLAMVG